MKRLDSDLPFYYHTSGKQHFYEGCLMPHFDEDPGKRKQKRIPRYELLEYTASSVDCIIVIVHDSIIECYVEGTPRSSYSAAGLSEYPDCDEDVKEGC